jgi:pimeloyl-ACP methyl ester carboxylesterase
MKRNSILLILLLQLFYLCSCKNSNSNKSIQNNSYANPDVKSVFINGDSIHYIDIGKGDPVVFVHGAVGDYRTWKAQMDAFAKNNRVISYSRRFSYPNKQVITDSSYLTVISHSKDLSEFLRTLNLGPAHLVGHSFGGSTALLTAIDHPELVRSLILAEPFVPTMLQNVPGGDTILNQFATKTFGSAAEAINNNNDEQALNALIAGVTGDSLYSSRLPQKDREIMMANTAELRGILFSKNIFPPVTCDDVKKIKAPVLFVNGDLSPIIFSLIIDELSRCTSNKEIVKLIKTNHGLEYENPAEFNKAVLGFIAKH